MGDIIQLQVTEGLAWLGDALENADDMAWVVMS